MGNKSVLTYTAWDKTYTVELDYCDLDVDDLINMFKGLAILAGWNSETIEEALTEYGQKLNLEKE